MWEEVFKRLLSVAMISFSLYISVSGIWHGLTCSNTIGVKKGSVWIATLMRNEVNGTCRVDGAFRLSF